MADKILPQRVSAFHSSPQPPPTLCCSALLPPSGADLQPHNHFHFLFKKLIKK